MEKREQITHIHIVNDKILLSHKLRKYALEWAKKEYKNFRSNGRDKETMILNVYYGRTSEIAFRAIFKDTVKDLSRVNTTDGPDGGYDFSFMKDGKSFRINVKSLDKKYKQLVTFNDRYDTSDLYSLITIDGYKYLEDLEDSISYIEPETWKYEGTVNKVTMNKHKFFRDGWNKPVVYRKIFKENRLKHENIINNSSGK